MKKDVWKSASFKNQVEFFSLSFFYKFGFQIKKFLSFS